MFDSRRRQNRPIELGNEDDTASTGLFGNVLVKAAQMPGVRINRERFLQKALAGRVEYRQLIMAIHTSPAEAGIPLRVIRRAVKKQIKLETRRVATLSFTAGIPGGLATLATVPADTLQFFAHTLRMAQKLAYLYSWPDLFNPSFNANICREQALAFPQNTQDILTLLVGVMFGVEQANLAVAKIASQLVAQSWKHGSPKGLTQILLTKATKKVATKIGAKINHRLLGQGATKMVPIAGGVVSGALAYSSFKNMAYTLAEYLQTLPIVQPTSE